MCAREIGSVFHHYSMKNHRSAGPNNANYIVIMFKYVLIIW